MTDNATTVELRDGTRIHANAVVRWIKAVPQKGAYASGVQFMQVTDKDRKHIRRFLHELDQTSGL